MKTVESETDNSDNQQVFLSLNQLFSTFFSIRKEPCGTLLPTKWYKGKKIINKLFSLKK